MQIKFNSCRSGCQHISGGRYTLLGPRDEGAEPKSQKVNYNTTAEHMMNKFAVSGHPVFRCSSSMSRGVLKKQRRQRTSRHFNTDPSTAQLLLETIVAVNQDSIYGAVAKWCKSERIRIKLSSSTKTTTYRPSFSQSSHSTRLFTCWRGDVETRRDELNNCAFWENPN